MEELLIPSTHFSDLRLVSKITKGNLQGWWNAISANNQSFFVKLLLKSDITDVHQRIKFASITSKWKKFEESHRHNSFELSQDPYTYYLITKKPDGVSLTDYLALYGTLNDDKLVQLAIDLAEEFSLLSEKGQSEISITCDQIFLDDKGNFTTLIPFTIQQHQDERYFSPEMFNCQWVSASCTWNLGIILYNSYVGSYPFTGETSDMLKESILVQSLIFPSSTEEKSKQMISQMLIKNFLLRDSISKVADSIISSRSLKTNRRDAFLNSKAKQLQDKEDDCDNNQRLTLSKRIRKLNSSGDVVVFSKNLMTEKKANHIRSNSSVLTNGFLPMQILSRK